MKTPRNARLIVRTLINTYPEPWDFLSYRNDYELLVLVILTAQTTDAQVNRAAPRLFARFPNAGSLAVASIREVEALVRSTGFFRNKARNIRATAQMLIRDFGGKVPVSMDDLLRLPGVGRKTANVIRSRLFGRPAIVVDTHFLRVVSRMGLVDERDPFKVEAAITRLLPEEMHTPCSTAMTRHGRRCCTARSPACARCPVVEYCDRIGV